MNVNENNNLMSVVRILGNVLFYTVIVVMLLFSIANLSIKSNDDVANIFGKGFLPVITDSMEGNEPDSFEKGSLIFVDVLSDKEKENLAVGDVITFYDFELKALNTHRIVEINDSYVVTQGDKARLSSEYVPGGNNDGIKYETVLYSDIKALKTGSISNLGSAVNYLQTPVGFALFIILPVVILLAYQGFVLTKALLAVNKEKLEAKYAEDKEQSLKDLEAEKEKIRKELLEELKKEQK